MRTFSTGVYTGMLMKLTGAMAYSLPHADWAIPARSNVLVSVNEIILSGNDESSWSVGAAFLSYEIDARYAAVRLGNLYDLLLNYSPSSSPDLFNRARFSTVILETTVLQCDLNMLFDLVESALSYLGVSYLLERPRYAIRPFADYLRIAEWLRNRAPHPRRPQSLRRLPARCRSQ